MLARMPLRVFPLGLLLVAAILFTGCATSTIESRKKERFSAYSELPPEQRSEVDQGHIKVGMNMDAVYIAWGKPSGVWNGESSQGALVNWIYQDVYYEYYPYYPYHSYYPYCYGPRGYYGAPYFGYGYSYAAQPYVRAEVHFLNGLVSEWRSLPSSRY